jgi:hypothetical protein
MSLPRIGKKEFTGTQLPELPTPNSIVKKNTEVLVNSRGTLANQETGPRSLRPVTVKKELPGRPSNSNKEILIKETPKITSPRNLAVVTPRFTRSESFENPTKPKSKGSTLSIVLRRLLIVHLFA